MKIPLICSFENLSVFNRLTDSSHLELPGINLVLCQNSEASIVKARVLCPHSEPSTVKALGSEPCLL